MGVIADIKQAPVDIGNAVADHTIADLRALLFESAEKLGPELAEKLETAIGAAMVQAGKAAESLTDHVADRIESNVPKLVTAIERPSLDLLTEYEFVLSLRKKT